MDASGAWRWNGVRWEVRTAAPSGGGGGSAALAGIGIVVGVLFLTSFVVIVILVTMGGLIENVFSNVVGALATP